MEETKDFDIYVVGSFVDIINGRFDDFDLDKIYSDEELEDMTDKELIMLDRALTNTNDIDVILIGSDKSIDDKKKIKKLMYEGMRLGWEKYGIFVDLLWFKKLEFFDIKDVKNINKYWTKIYLPSDKFISNDELITRYHGAKEDRDVKGLWHFYTSFPTKKQRERILAGYEYPKPILITK